MIWVTIGIGIACLMTVSLIEHLTLASLARQKPIIGYLSGVLGVLIPCWGMVLLKGGYTSDFVLGMLTISLGFVPFGAVTILLHYIQTTDLLDAERTRRFNAEKTAGTLRTLIDERDGQ